MYIRNFNNNIMEIRIIDDSGVRMNFEFEYRNSTPKLFFNQVIDRIKIGFKQQFEKINELFEYPDEIIFTITLEQESNVDSNILALFNAEKSIKNEYYFNLYYNTTKQIIECIYNNNENYHEYNDTFLHELIHAADLFAIKKTDKLELQNKKVAFKGNFHGNDLYLKNQETTFNWTVLHIIERFRNEGIAVLGETLLGKKDHDFKDMGVDDYLMVFKNTIESCIKACEKINLIESLLEKKQIFDVLQDKSQEAYCYGHIVFLMIVALQNGDKKEVCFEIVDYLCGKKTERPSATDTMLILKAAMQIDLSDYINSLIKSPFHDMETSIIDKEIIFNYCAYIQGETNYEAISILNDNSYNRAHEMFVKLMKMTVGYKMSSEEIIKYSTNFSCDDTSEEIKKCIKRQLDLLLPLAIKNENEIAIWALTYLFDEEELIYDSIPIFGYQDDWLVLDAALRLINNYNI